MPTSDSSTLRRYRGVLVWIDANGKRTRQGLVNRALLRRQGLAVEFTSGGQSYDVSLRPSADGRFEGMWTRGQGTQQVSGAAECRLSPCGTFLVQPGEVNMKLEGVWHEEGQWDWLAKLRPLAAPPETP
jgi:hypothetical protein